MAKWLVGVGESGNLVFENITVDEMIARLSKALDVTVALVGKEISDEQKNKYIFDTFEDGTVNGNSTRAERDEAAVKLGFPTLAEKEQAEKAKIQEQSDAAWKKFWVVKPQPSPKHYACGKCGGTGKFVLYMENGSPKSNTGFDCYACGGAGWKLHKSRK
jgi:hypothetical protein